MLRYHLNAEIDLSSRRGEFIDRSVAWISSQFNITPATKIADFGCGPGLYTNRLAKQGAKVTGIDFSKTSIEYASKVATGEEVITNYVNQNYLDFETEDRFELILMIMCDFCALSPEQRKLMLRKFHSLLLPGGCVLLDVYSLNAYEHREEATSYGLNLLDGFWSPEMYYGFLNTFKYDEKKVILDKYTIVEAARTRTVYNWLQYFSPEALQKELGRAGFVEQKLYGDVAGTSFDESLDEFAVVGRRP
jgi:2-polyprenyl-3-methyl-5-hydroxy-6-metoxy-1,4-benzoquinol methylase